MAPGRPRGIDDAAILRAAARAMGELGPAKLTLAAVAREAGVVPGTLVQRFGSKHGLLLALAELSVTYAHDRCERVLREHDSALEALQALLIDANAAQSTPRTFANHLAFLCQDLTDASLHEHALAVHRAQGQAIRALLAEATDTGELAQGTDLDALAATVQAITAGTGLTWALERQGTLAEHLSTQVDAVLAPHRTGSPTHEEQS